jgi:hypothetical protein
VAAEGRIGGEKGDGGDSDVGVGVKAPGGPGRRWNAGLYDAGGGGGAAAGGLPAAAAAAAETAAAATSVTVLRDRIILEDLRKQVRARCTHCAQTVHCHDCCCIVMMYIYMS